MKKAYRQYINLDGSSYEGAKSGIMRLINTPSFRGGIIISAFCAAAQAMTAPTSANHANDFLFFLALAISSSVVANSMDRYFCNQKCPVPPDTIIDKSGYKGDPEATLKLIPFYQKRATANLVCFILVDPLMLAMHTPITGHVYTLVLLMCSGWQVWAGHNLSKGKWSALTNPPVRRKEAKKASSVSAPQTAPSLS